MESIKLLVKNTGDKPETVILFNEEKNFFGMGGINSKDIFITAPDYPGGYKALQQKGKEDGIDIFRVYCSKRGFIVVNKKIKETTVAYTLHVVPVGMDAERKLLRTEAALSTKGKVSIHFIEPVMPGEEIEIDLDTKGPMPESFNPMVFPFRVENKTNSPKVFRLYRNRNKLCCFKK